MNGRTRRMYGPQMTKHLQRMLWLAPVLGALALGCASAAEPGSEDVQHTAEALTAPLLVATPTAVDFGRVPRGSTGQITVTIANRSATPAINIVPPDPYYPPDPFLPPDPYRVARNPPSDLPAYQSGAMILSFTAPRAAGPSSGTIVIGYQDAAGASYTLRVPVQGTSY